MTQQISPFLEAAYGWSYGESGWGTGMDSNLLKFSFLFNGNVDGVVSSLPAAVDGTAYYLTTDSRLYFCVGTTWYSSPTPRWFQFRNKNTGVLYEYNGTFLSEIQSPTQLGGRLDAVESTINSLGTAAFQDVSAFATQSALDVAVGQAQAYTDTLRSDLAATSGSSLVGFIQAGTGAVARTTQTKQRERVSVKDFGAVGNGTADDTTAIQAAIDYVGSIGGGTVYVPEGTYKITSTINVNKSDVKLIGAGRGDRHYVETGPRAATMFLWNGSNTNSMVNVESFDDTWIANCSVEGIFFQAANSALHCVRAVSCQGGRFLITGGFPLGYVFYLTTKTISDTKDSMENYIEVRGNASASGGLLYMGAGSGVAGNSCFNRVGYVDGNYTNGAAIVLENSDNNILEHIRVSRAAGGTAYGVVLAGGELNGECRSNFILDCSPSAGGLIAKGTPSYSSASKQNYILFYDTPNGAPLPVIEAGATLWYSTNDNKFPAFAASDFSSTVYSSAVSNVTWNSEVYDLQSNFASPSFTAPKPGKYRFYWQLGHTAAVTAGDRWTISLVSTSEAISTAYTIASANVGQARGEATVNLNTGDTVKLTIERASGSGTWTMLNDSRFNRFEGHYISQSF